MESRKIALREAALSQIDMLTPAMSGDIITPEGQVDMVNMVRGDVSNTGSNASAKFIPKSAPQVEVYPDQKDKTLEGLGSHLSSFGPVIIH
jgi:hypothetical protein